MTSSRTEILARIRRAQQQAFLPDVTGITPPPPQPPPFEMPLIDVFEEALMAVQGIPHRCSTAQEAAALIAASCQKQGQSQALSWDPETLPLPGLTEALADLGIELIPSHLGIERQQELNSLSPLRVGVTGAAAGLARTGSIVLHGDGHHGRLASLLPDIHLAILREEDIYPDIAAWIATDEAARKIAASSNTVIITGPSRTADIAQTLTLGAHGPRELHVIILQSEVRSPKSEPS